MVRDRAPSPVTRRLLGALLADGGGWRHGYDLARTAEIASGTLYPLLMRLEARGLLEARWEPPALPGRPPRHAYRLTAAGAAYAREHARVAQGAAATALPR